MNQQVQMNIRQSPLIASVIPNSNRQSKTPTVKKALVSSVNLCGARRRADHRLTTLSYGSAMMARAVFATAMTKLASIGQTIIILP